MKDSIKYRIEVLNEEHRVPIYLNFKSDQDEHLEVAIDVNRPELGFPMYEIGLLTPRQEKGDDPIFQTDVFDQAYHEIIDFLDEHGVDEPEQALFDALNEQD